MNRKYWQFASLIFISEKTDIGMFLSAKPALTQFNCSLTWRCHHPLPLLEQRRFQAFARPKVEGFLPRHKLLHWLKDDAKAKEVKRVMRKPLSCDVLAHLFEQGWIRLHGQHASHYELSVKKENSIKLKENQKIDLLKVKFQFFLNFVQ